jgi:putative colanic acid biosynthesis acetyltransferase WcaF
MSDLANFSSQLGFRNKALRLLWGMVWTLLFRPSPRTAFRWRAMLLRLFGARLGQGVRIYNSANIYYPPHLEAQDFVVIGPWTDIYCVAPIRLAANVMVSQYAHLCAATHDYRVPSLPLVAKPIAVGEGAWVCAGAFVGPGVTIGEEAVVGARAVVFKDVAPGKVVVGNPAVVIKERYPEA